MGHTDADVQLAARFFGQGAPHAIAGRDVIGGASVNLIYHDPENGWWFSSGGPDEDEELGTICLPCLLNTAPDLVELADLPLNWIAERDGPDASWTREPRPDDWGPWETDDD